MPDNSWDEWRNHVLLELEENSKQMKNIYESLNNVKIEIAKLKVKSGVWGALAGAIPASIILIYMYVKNKFGGQ